METVIYLNGFKESYSYVASLIGKNKLNNMIETSIENYEKGWTKNTTTFGNITIEIN